MPTSQSTHALAQPSANQLDTKAQAWSALFSEPMSELVKRYTSSVFFDKRLWQADTAGSLAHAEMLAAQGIISADDHAAIQRGMAQITQEIESGAFEWKLDLEDVHLNIEARLTPGMYIGQMLFYRVSEVPKDRSYAAVGRYNNDTSVQTVKP